MIAFLLAVAVQVTSYNQTGGVTAAVVGTATCGSEDGCRLNDEAWRYRIDIRPAQKDVTGMSINSGYRIFYDKPACMRALYSDPNMTEPRYRRNVIGSRCYRVQIVEVKE